MGRLTDGLHVLAQSITTPTLDRFDRAIARLPQRADERYLGGVAGGIARSLDVDPMIVRLGFALGALYLPALSIVYTLGWVLMPDERSGRSLLQSTREPNGWRLVLGVVALGIGATILVPDLGPDGNRGLTAGVVLLGLGVLLVLRKPNGLGRSGIVGPRGLNLEPTDAAAGSEGDVDGGGQTATATAPVRGRVRRDPAPPSYLGWLAISLVAMLAGGLAAIDYNWSVKPGVAVSLALVVVGSALLMATWWGRARLLLPLGLALLPLWAAVVLPDVPRYEGEGQVIHSLTSGESLPRAFEHGYGSMEVDLRRVRFEAGDRQVLHVGLTAGAVQVHVPRDVFVTVRGDVGAGEVEIWDQWRVDDSGPVFAHDVDLSAEEYQEHPRCVRSWVYPPDAEPELEWRHVQTGEPCTPPEPASNPSRLDIVLDVGIGRVEVHRA